MKWTRWITDAKLFDSFESAMDYRIAHCKGYPAARIDTVNGGYLVRLTIEPETYVEDERIYRCFAAENSATQDQDG